MTGLTPEEIEQGLSRLTPEEIPQLKSTLSWNEATFRRERGKTEDTPKRHNSSPNIKIKRFTFKKAISKILERVKKEHRDEVTKIMLDRPPYMGSIDTI